MNVISVEIRYTSHSYKIHENHVGAPYGRRASRSCFFVSARSGCQLGVATPVSRAPAGGAGGVTARRRTRGPGRPPGAGRGACGGAAAAARGRRTRVASPDPVLPRSAVCSSVFVLFCYIIHHAPHKPVARSSPRPRGYVGISLFRPARDAAHPRAAGKQGAIEKQGAGKGGA